MPNCFPPWTQLGTQQTVSAIAYTGWLPVLYHAFLTSSRAHIGSPERWRTTGSTLTIHPSCVRFTPNTSRQGLVSAPHRTDLTTTPRDCNGCAAAY